MGRRALFLLVQALLVVTAAGCGTSSAAARPSPSPSPTLSASAKAELATLESRPLKYLPLVKGKCQADGLNTQTGLFGSDPLYAEGGPHSVTPYGDYYDVSLIIKPGVPGPVLVRGSDLLAANHPLVFVSTSFGSFAYPAGPVYGTDPRYGKQYTEMVIDTSHATSVEYPVGGALYNQYFWTQGIGAGWSGCVGVQFDTPGFTEDININEPPS